MVNWSEIIAGYAKNIPGDKDQIQQRGRSKVMREETELKLESQPETQEDPTEDKDEFQA